MTPLYEMQRGMRAMRRAAIGRGVIGLLDIGTHKVSCAVLRVGPGRDVAQLSGPPLVGPMAGQARVTVIGAHATRSRGVRLGEIASMHETERAIRTAVQGAQREAGVRVDHVIASLAGAAPESAILDGEVELADEACTEYDIARALSACEVQSEPGRHVLHAQPVQFALDHRGGLPDPRGQIGRRLSTHMHVMTVEAAAIRNLAVCLKRCDLELAGVAGSAYAAGLAALVEDEQELGAACIDLGGGTTSISIFARRHMVHAATVPLGGEHVTLDLSKGLQVPLARAEAIKARHGGVIATGADDRDIIALGGESGDWERDRRTATRSHVIGIMRPRIEEILEEVAAALHAAEFHLFPSQTAVLTGGASQVPGIVELAQRVLGIPVRQGHPVRIRGLPQSHQGSEFSATVGLALFAAHPQDEWWDFDVPSQAGGARSLGRAFRWLRENW